jgi:hypothetical protein
VHEASDSAAEESVRILMARQQFLNRLVEYVDNRTCASAGAFLRTTRQVRASCSTPAILKARKTI